MVESIPKLPVDAWFPASHSAQCDWFVKYASINFEEALRIIGNTPHYNFCCHAIEHVVHHTTCSDRLFLEALSFFDPNGSYCSAFYIEAHEHDIPYDKYKLIRRHVAEKKGWCVTEAPKIEPISARENFSRDEKMPLSIPVINDVFSRGDWFEKYAPVNLKEVLRMIKESNLTPSNFYCRLASPILLIAWDIECSDEDFLEALKFFDPNGNICTNNVCYEDVCYKEYEHPDIPRNKYKIMCQYVAEKKGWSIKKDVSEKLRGLPISDLRLVVKVMNVKPKGNKKTDYVEVILQNKDMSDFAELVIQFL